MTPDERNLRSAAMEQVKDHGTWTERELDMLAEKMIDRAMTRLLERIGYDITTPQSREEIREDHAWVRRWRRGSTTAAFTAGGVGVTSIIGGLLWLLWYGMKAAIRLPG